MMDGRLAKVLLVDDDASMIALLKKLIERDFSEQVEIETSTDPGFASQRLQDTAIDILVTDLEMPGLNGLQLLRVAKRKNGITQVLFMTGHSSYEALLAALEWGATDYLLKPLDQKEFVRLLKESLERLARWKRALAGTLRQQAKGGANDAIGVQRQESDGIA